MSSPTLPATVPAYLGRVLGSTGSAVGTCFQLSSGVLVTAWHVLSETATGASGAAVQVGPLAGDEAWSATVHAVDELSDLAVLISDRSLGESAPGWLATDSVPATTDVQITGVASFPDSRPFRLTSTTGIWQGVAQRTDGAAVGQVDAKNLVMGMSGAPVCRATDGSVVGVVSGRYLSGSSTYLQHSVWVARTEDLIALLDGLDSVPDLLAQPAERYAKSLASDFVGREYVFDSVEQFFQQNRNGVFTLVGDPGEGKTAICAELARRTGCVVHFNSRPEGINTAAQCYQAVSDQLAADLRISVSDGSIGSDLGAAWVRLVEKAAAAAEFGQRIVIALDALDEVDTTGVSAGSNILLLPSALPDNIYLFLTRRRVDLPLVSRAPQMVYDLADHRVKSLEDIKLYLWAAVGRGLLDRWTRSQRLTADEAVDALAAKSQYNFMYLHYVLPEIAGGAYSLTGHEELPVGLRGYYEDHWTRMGMRERPAPRTKLLIICGLAEIRRPISLAFLSEVLKQDPVDVQEILTEWRQFLLESDRAGRRAYSIYHASFADFLRSKEVLEAAQQSLALINSSIADQLQAELLGPDDGAQS